MSFWIPGLDLFFESFPFEIWRAGGVLEIPPYSGFLSDNLSVKIHYPGFELLVGMK